MRHGSLFSGIGGFDLAAKWMGWENVFHCEWNPFGQKVLHYYWPEAEQFTDITKSDFTKYANKIDILTGGFPCQPYSMAGKRLGKEDERHLWPEMLRAIREIQPTWIVGENVFGLINWNGGMVFDEVQADLEAEGYEVQPYVLPAAAVNAPHRRDRVWFVAYRNNNGLNQCDSKHEKHTSEGRLNAFCNTCQSFGHGDAADTDSPRWQQGNKKMERGSSEQSDSSCFQQDAVNSDCLRCERSLSSNMPRQFPSEKVSSKVNLLPIGGRREKLQFQDFPTVSPICDGDDGISDRLDSITFSKWRTESIKAGGNAIVPQVALQIFKAIEQYELKNS